MRFAQSARSNEDQAHEPEAVLGVHAPNVKQEFFPPWSTVVVSANSNGAKLRFLSCLLWNREGALKKNYTRTALLPMAWL